MAGGLRSPEGLRGESFLPSFLSSVSSGHWVWVDVLHGVPVARIPRLFCICQHGRSGCRVHWGHVPRTSRICALCPPHFLQPLQPFNSFYTWKHVFPSRFWTHHEQVEAGGKHRCRVVISSQRRWFRSVSSMFTKPAAEHAEHGLFFRSWVMLLHVV